MPGITFGAKITKMSKRVKVPACIKLNKSEKLDNGAYEKEHNRIMQQSLK